MEYNDVCNVISSYLNDHNDSKWNKMAQFLITHIDVMNGLNFVIWSMSNEIAIELYVNIGSTLYGWWLRRKKNEYFQYATASQFHDLYSKLDYSLSPLPFSHYSFHITNTLIRARDGLLDLYAWPFRYSSV